MKANTICNTRTIALAVYLVTMYTGCSHKGVYQDLQRNKRNECMQAPSAEYDRCMRAMDMSYEEYERQRQQALKDEEHNGKEQ